MYGLEGNGYGYENTANTGGAWCLSSIEKKPGLKIQSKNQWEILKEESDDFDNEQRTSDSKTMERAYEQNFPKSQMGNYSKSQQKEPKKKMQAVQKKDMVPLMGFVKEKPKDLPLDLLYPEEVQTELHPCISNEKGGWRRIKGVMDSGASASVAHPSECPDYEVVPSAGSKIGQEYTSASGDPIPNLGEKTLDVVTDDGIETQIKYQAADVSRTLNSVSEVCDAGGPEGQYVMFTKWGGSIWNPVTGRTTKFAREGGIYTLDMWVKPKAASGFTRPGM